MCLAGLFVRREHTMKMFDEKNSWSRRDFIKIAGSTGLGVALFSGGNPGSAAEEGKGVLPAQAQVPQRLFGQSGKHVSILSLGGMFDIPSNQLLLKQALRWGVTYWDTADCYGGGASEQGIGQYLKKYPDDRARIFLVTKSDEKDPEGLSRLLDQSLERMNTTYIDLYFIHGISSVDDINGNTRKWAEAAKAKGKIRLFGFSTHRNMEKCLSAAAKLGWIDGIMMTYNYRLMHTDPMKKAVEACAAAGIGLTAMKTQGGGAVGTTTETELQLAGRFLNRGFSDKQAKLKAIWENHNIASICSQMPSLTILMSNIAAALDKTTLAAADRQLLEQYAAETASDYCAGCAHLCESRIGGCVPIGDVMRYLMYARSYGDRDRARELYRAIPLETRRNIHGVDYAAAENHCPRKMAIGRLMREAAVELA